VGIHGEGAFLALDTGLWLCYASLQASAVDLLDLANPDPSGLNWKLTLVPINLKAIYGWALV
jgi:hypothetical protein